MKDPRYLSTAQAAHAIGVCIGTLKTWLRDGKVPEPDRNPANQYRIWKLSEVNDICRRVRGSTSSCVDVVRGELFNNLTPLKERQAELKARMTEEHNSVKRLHYLEYQQLYRESKRKAKPVTPGMLAAWGRQWRTFMIFAELVRRHKRQVWKVWNFNKLARQRRRHDPIAVLQSTLGRPYRT